MTDTTAVTEELKRALAAEEGGRRWLRRLAVAGGIAIAIGGGLVWRSKNRPPPPAKFVTASVVVGDVAEKVQATGTVQPLLQINIGAQVNGRVTKVNVDFNSTVKKNDVLAEIDPTILGTQVNAQAAGLQSQRAQYEASKAQVESTRAQLDMQKIAYDRVQRLFAANLSTKAELDAAHGQYEVIKGTLEAAQANMHSAAASIGASQAQLTQSTTNLSYTKIIAPVDGVVVSRGIDPGATVVASFQAPTLFIIAQDLRKMRVLADVDEADVGKLAEKMQADAVVDAFPGEAFHGVVSQIRFSPNNVSGVVTYPAIVEVDNPEEKLRPGMTATITIKTRESKNIPRIPNAALRYKPSPPMGPDGKPAPQPPEAPLPKGQGRVYVLVSDKPGEEKQEMRIIPIGVTDGVNTEVFADSLPVDTKVVTDETDSEDKKKKAKLF